MKEKRRPILYLQLISLDLMLRAIPMMIWTRRLRPKQTAELSESPYANSMIAG